MNQITWQGKIRQLRGEFKREWGKFTHNDRRRIEGEFDRMVGQMQQNYGYSRERALHELEHYWQAYGKPMQSAVQGSLHKDKKAAARSMPWVTLAIGLLGLLLVVTQLRKINQPKPELSHDEKKRQESIRQEKERDYVDEQSWESFPASDPPASW